MIKRVKLPPVDLSCQSDGTIIDYIKKNGYGEFEKNQRKLKKYWKKHYREE